MQFIFLNINRVITFRHLHTNVSRHSYMWTSVGFAHHSYNSNLKQNKNVACAQVTCWIIVLLFYITKLIDLLTKM